MEEELSEEELDELFRNVDMDNSGEIDYMDFLVASIDTSKKSFITYCHEAFNLFFNSSEDPIETQELIEILCKGKFLKEELVKDILEQIDQDKSNSVTFSELVEAFITNLDLE